MGIITVHIDAGFLAVLIASAGALVVLFPVLARRGGIFLRRVAPSLREKFVDVLGSLVADVLSHPLVGEALATAIARGINEWLKGPEAQDAIKAMVSGAPKNDAAKEFGHQVPGLAGNFATGVVAGIATAPRDFNKNRRDRMSKKVILEKEIDDAAAAGRFEIFDCTHGLKGRASETRSSACNQ